MVERPGQQLRLFANQAVAHVDASQVVRRRPPPRSRCRPPATSWPCSSPDRLALRHRLPRHDRRRLERLPGQASTLEARFSTPPRRCTGSCAGPSGADDRIESSRAPRGSDRRRCLVGAAHPGLRGVRLGGRGRHRRRDAEHPESRRDGSAAADGPAPPSRPCRCPTPGLITRFAADRATTTLAFSFRPRARPTRRSITLPLQGAARGARRCCRSVRAARHRLRLVLGAGGRRRRRPGARRNGQPDRPLGSRPGPARLGTYSQLQGVSLDGTSLTAARRSSRPFVDLATGDETPRAPAPSTESCPYGGPLVPLGSDRRSCSRCRCRSDDGSSFRYARRRRRRHGVPDALYAAAGARGARRGVRRLARTGSTWPSSRSGTGRPATSRTRSTPCPTGSRPRSSTSPAGRWSPATPASPRAGDELV